MPRLLDKIDNPTDLKGLTQPELKQLASEIRQELVAIVSDNGGHLASNLGVVELTIALHRVFNSQQVLSLFP
jgi:1-deoxy-D-xylulose-5-phosphate synthase